MKMIGVSCPYGNGQNSEEQLKRGLLAGDQFIRTACEH